MQPSVEPGSRGRKSPRRLAACHCLSRRDEEISAKCIIGRARAAGERVGNVETRQDAWQDSIFLVSDCSLHALPKLNTATSRHKSLAPYTFGFESAQRQCEESREALLLHMPWRVWLKDQDKCCITWTWIPWASTSTCHCPREELFF